eukprot:6086929-Prymnesium_polylepis.1
MLSTILGHLAVMLPTLPSGQSLQLSVPGYGRGYGTGGSVWPAAAALCGYLRREQPSLNGLAVCELGSGIGAVGVYAAALGAQAVCLSDMSDSLCQCASDNAATNARHFADGASVVSRTYVWGRPTCQLGGAPFDLVLGSDVTYRHGMHRSLCKTLAELLTACDAAGGQSCRALLSHQHRPVAELLNQVDTLALLEEAAETAGLELRVVHLEQTLLPLSRISVLEMQLVHKK